MKPTYREKETSGTFMLHRWRVSISAISMETHPKTKLQRFWYSFVTHSHLLFVGAAIRMN